MVKAREIELRAVVGKVREEGGYFIAYPQNDMPELGQRTSITCSLNGWEDELFSFPEPGQVVILSGVRLFQKGWRARSARPVTLVF